MADDPKFTESQHFALLADAVSRETASLTEAKTALETEKSELQEKVTGLESEKSSLQSRIDVLEAEKAAEIASREQAEQEFAQYQADLAELAAVQERMANRVERVQASIDAPADYFTEARAQRWAQMADEEFDALLADLAEHAASKPKGKDDEDEKDDLPPFLKKKKADDSEKARETAAFTGGDAPTAPEGGSLFGKFLTATGKLPVASS